MITQDDIDGMCKPVDVQREVKCKPTDTQIKSDGGPSGYYDLKPEWKTFNDFMEDKALNQWGAYSLHFKDIGKALCRFGVKAGTSNSYDIRKIIYSGLRLLVMIEGRDSVARELEKLSNDPQFMTRKL